MTRTVAVVTIISLSLVLAGCSGSEKKSAAQKINYEQSGLTKTVRTTKKPGTGQVAEVGDLVVAEYRGQLINGVVFDSNDDRNSKGEPEKPPYGFVIGRGEVIRGWDIGFTGMRVGEEARFEIPSSEGYADKGSGGNVPPNATLIFDVKLLDVVKPSEADQVVAKDVKAGSGASVKAGDKVQISYVVHFPNGKIFEDSADYSTPVEFKLGQDDVLPGISAGMEGMKVGGIRTLRLTPTLYGGANSRVLTNVNTPVTYTITLVKKY